MPLCVTISGSYKKHLPRILQIRKTFLDNGIVVCRPDTDEIISTTEEIIRLKGDPTDPRRIQIAQLEAIKNSDMLYLVNPGGYVGSASTGEVGYAKALGKIIITMEPAFEEWVADIADTIGEPEKAIQYFKSHLEDK